MAAEDPLTLVGSTIANLRFDECIDATGFGVVYRARRADRDGRIAIKCFRLSQLQHTNEAMRAAIASRFEPEAQLLGRIADGNADIVRWLGTGELSAAGERVPYVVIDWIDGRTLEADLEGRRRRGAGGRTLHEAIELLESAANALAHGHANGAVHRNVEPSNLMLAHTHGGTRLKVLDFALAKILTDDPVVGIAPILTTIDGTPLYSPSYAAPEQFSVEVGALGPWTDIYSLALVLLELLKGEPVRPAETIAKGLVAALDPKTGSPTATALGLRLPDAVEELLARAVAQKPLERPASAGVFWSALKEVAGPPPRKSGVPAHLTSTVLGVEPLRALDKLRAPPVPGDGAPGPAPFTGTLLMVDAPRGALHLLGASAKAAPGAAPSPAGASTKAMPPLTGRAMASPLAASLGPGIASPLGGPPPAILMPSGAPSAGGEDDVAFRATQLAGDPMFAPGPPPPAPSPAPGRVASPVPPPRLTPAPVPPRGPGLVIGLLLLLLLAVVVCAALLLHLHPR